MPVTNAELNVRVEQVLSPGVTFYAACPKCGGKIGFGIHAPCCIVNRQCRWVGEKGSDVARPFAADLGLAMGSFEKLDGAGAEIYIKIPDGMVNECGSVDIEYPRDVHPWIREEYATLDALPAAICRAFLWANGVEI